MTDRKLFGTDGVRGVANRHPMTSEVALGLGRAIAHIMRRGARRHAIVIGKDTRLSGYMIETALASGICSMGVDVMLVGPLPTPGIAFITKGMRADAGVVISASHNPYQDNGIKFFDRDGFKLPDVQEAEIEQLIGNGAIDAHRPTAEEIGKATRIDDAAGRYITFLKSTVPAGMTFDGMKIVVDCAHGAGYRVAPAVLSELGATVIAVGVNPDGRNINAGCGALHPELAAKLTREQGAACGIAIDGDADRVILIDGDGNVVDGDALLAMCAIDLATRDALPQRAIVATTMSNLGLDVSLAAHNVRVLRSDVGDRYVMQLMREQGVLLGGEQSGHVIFAEHSSTGDGVLAALQVLAMMQRTGKSLAELRRVFTPIPQIMTNVHVRERKPLDQVGAVVQMIAAYEKELGNRGRIVVRYSGTEPLLRVMVEGESAERIRNMAGDIATAVGAAIGV